MVIVCDISRTFLFSIRLSPGSLVEGCSRIAPTRVSVLSAKLSPEKKLGSIAIISCPTPGESPSALRKELASKPKLEPVSPAASISTISASALPLASPIGSIAPPSAFFASVVGLPSLSIAQPSGIFSLS